MDKYQKELDEWFKKAGWPYWKPHEMMVRLMEEVGELAREINHLYGPKKKKANEKEQFVEDEIGDIIYTLICYANAHDIKLDAAIRKSMDKVVSRDKNRFN